MTVGRARQGEAHEPSFEISDPVNKSVMLVI